MSDKKTGAATAAPNSAEAEKIAALEQQLASVNEGFKVLSEENEELKKELKDAAKIVAELKAKLSDGGSKDVTVTVDKKVYVVTKGFRDKNKIWNKEDIAADPAKAKELIERGSTILKLKKK